MKKRNLILIRRSHMLISAAALAAAATADVSRAQLVTITFNGANNSLSTTSSYTPAATPNSGDLADIAAIKLASGGTTGYMSVAGSTGSSVTLGALAYDVAAPGGLVILDSTSSSSNANASTLNLAGANTGATLQNTGDTVASGDLITINSVFNGTLDIRGEYNGMYPATQSGPAPTGVGATIALGTTTGNFDIASNSTLEFGPYGSLSGSANVNITGGGTLEVLTITPSSVAAPYGNIALGLPGFSGGFTVTAGSTLAIYNTSSLSFGANNTTTTLSNGTIFFHSDAGLGTGHPIALAGVGGTINVPSGTEGIGGLVSGGSAGSTLTKAGSGTLNLNAFSNVLATNTFSGSVAVTGGTLLISNSTDLGNATTLNLNGGIFAYNGASHTANSVTTTYLTTSTPSALGVSLSASSNTINVGSVSSSLASLTIQGPVSGSGALVKADVGALILSASNTYSGGTTISAGSLFVNNVTGSGTGGGSVSVNAGTLGGNGTISGQVAVAASATLSPGTQSYGTLSTGATNLADNAKLNISVDSDTGSFSALSVSGVLSLGTSAGVLLSVTDVGTNTADAIGIPFTVVTASDSVTGSFSGLTTGTVVASNNFSYAYTINDPNGLGGTDNVTLTLEATPEPASLGLFSVAGLLMLRRRRSSALTNSKQEI